MKNLLKQYGDLDIDGEMIKLKSIRSKLLKNFLIVIISTITILDILTILCLKGYYYKSTQNSLINELESSINFYQKYFSNKKLMENIYDNADVLWNAKEEQIEVLDSNGNLLMDSYGIRDNKLLSTPDIIKAKNGEIGVWSGYIDSYNEKVMVISKGVNSKIDENEMIGIIRIIFSLQEVHKVLDSFAILILFVSLIVIVLGIIMSLIVAMDIVNPIKKITRVAKEMADGNLEIRSNFTDNIEITQLSNTLNYMGSEIEKREKLKNEFISSVSHELRTPLTAIKGWAITLKYDYSDTDTLELGLNIIEKESERLAQMVEELLDFSKLINGVITLNKNKCDIKVLLEFIENNWKIRAIEEGKKFTVNIQGDIGVAIFDENRLKQVLNNVIDNSFKFTEKNGRININANRNENILKLIIEDNGVGIKKEDLPRVKDKFYKGKNSKSKNGIGLSISDEIIMLHGGSFEIFSKENEGTKVIIEIPLV